MGSAIATAPFPTCCGFAWANHGVDSAERRELCVLECNIDDMNPECYDHVLERLFAAGANDAWLTTALMKKNRPATVLSVLCAPVLAPTLTEVLLTETTTLGVRQYPVTRTALARETFRVDDPLW